MEFLQNVDWKFWIGNVLVPIVTAIIGLFSGIHIERYNNKKRYNIKKINKTKAKANGKNSTIIQNSEINRDI